MAQGRCRLRIRAQGLVHEIVGALRLPACKLEEAASEGEAAVYLLDCLPENARWAETTKAELTRRFDAWHAGFTLQLASVECRSQRCRVLLSFQNPADAERMRSEEFSGALGFTRDFGGALSGIEPAADGKTLGMTVVIFRADNGWTTQRSAYEYQLARESRLARLREEARDASWADGMEQAVKAHYEERLGAGAVRGVECRTSRCEVAIAPQAAAHREMRLGHLRLVNGCDRVAGQEDWDATLGRFEVHTLTCRR